MRHEHEITRELEIDGVLRSEELVGCENGWALILENTEGLPLRKLMDSARLDLLDSLKIAVSLRFLFFGKKLSLHLKNI